MPARVEILPADERRPTLAAHVCLDRLLRSVPKRREITLGIMSHGNMPGLGVPPWTLRAALDCFDARKLRLRDVFVLGDPEAGQRLFERASFGHPSGSITPFPPSGRESLRIKLPETGVPARVPAHWVGTNLVLLAPLCHQRARAGAWTGPLVTSVRNLAAGLGYHAPSDPALAIGARLISDVFATSTVLLDATWWAAADDEGRLACDPTAPEHVLGIACNELDDMKVVDEWLDGLLNLAAATTGHQRSHARVPFVTGRRKPWPIARLPARPLPAEGLAGRAVKALWGRRSLPAPVRAALRPSVPGKFSSAWSSYRPVDFDRS